MMLGDTQRGIDMSYYEKNPSWDIVDSKWGADFTETESSITFTLTLRRKPLYAILTIVFPILLLCLLDICTFVLPRDGGEKAGFAVTLFLTFVVLLTIIQSTLPSSSDSVAAFSVYVILMTSMSAIIKIIVVFENRCNAWDVEKVPIPKWVKFLADIGRLKLCTRSCRRNTSETKVEDLTGKSELPNGGLVTDESVVDTEEE